MTIDELEADLPNGLHDALLRTFSSDVPERRAEFILDVWLGDLGSSVTAERERYRAARLELLGLAYLVVDESRSGDTPWATALTFASMRTPQMTTRNDRGRFHRADSLADSSSPNGTRSSTSLRATHVCSGSARAERQRLALRLISKPASA